MVFGIDDALLAAIVGGAASIGGGLLSSAGNKETKMQKTQRHLVDKLLGSLQGGGPYSDLFDTSESQFQKSFVEPAQQRFRSQIAPQIQQEYIASGQQRGTGLEDQLLRAGVDLNSLLNQQYSQFAQQGLNRKQNILSNILGQGAGAPAENTFGQNLSQSIGGYLSGTGFSDLLARPAQQQQPQMQSTNIPGLQPTGIPPRKGYTNDWMDWQLGDKRWGQ